MNTERLAGLLGEATALPWAYRPCEHDDWGWIRGPERDSDIGRYRPIVANARNSDVSESEFAKHRVDKTDPYGPNAMLIVEAVNALPTLLSRLAALEGLRKYVRHDALCGIVGGYGYCTCGLDATLAQAVAGEGEKG